MTIPAHCVEEYPTAAEQAAMHGRCLAVWDGSPVHRTLISYLAGSVNVNWSVCSVHSSPLIRLQFAWIFQRWYWHCWLEFHLHKPHEAQKGEKKKIYFQFCAPQISTTHQCYSFSQLPIVSIHPFSLDFFCASYCFSTRLLPFVFSYHIIICSRIAMLISLLYLTVVVFFSF